MAGSDDNGLTSAGGSISSSIGNNISLSPSTITALSNGIGNSLSTILRSLLPMIASSVSNATGYLNGVNRYAPSSFMGPLSGTNAFSSHQVNVATFRGLINKDSYLMNYANAFRGGGEPWKDASAASAFLNRSGYMGSMNQALERGMVFANRYGANAMYAMNASDQQRRNRFLERYGNDIRDYANSVTVRSAGIGTGNFTNIKQIREAIDSIKDEDLVGDDPRIEAKKKARDKLKKMLQVFEDTRSGEMTTGAAYQAWSTSDKVSGIEERIKKKKEDLEDARLVQDYSDADLAAMGDVRRRAFKTTSVWRGKSSGTRHTFGVDQWRVKYLEEELRRLEQEKAKYDEFREDVGSTFKNTTVAQRALNFSVLDEMAINSALALDETEAKTLSKTGDLGVARAEASRGQRNLIRASGSIENAKVLNSMITRAAVDAASWEQGGALYETLIGSGKLGGEDIRRLQKQLMSSDAEEAAAAKGQLAGFILQAGEKGQDKLGISAAAKTMTQALAATGGDQAAANDILNMAAAMEGKDSFAELSEEQQRSARRLIVAAKKLPGGDKDIAETFDQVSRALEDLGVATHNLYGKTTRFTGAVTKAALNAKLGLVDTGLSADTAAVISTEEARDFAESKAGQHLLAAAALAYNMEGGKEDFAASILQEYAGLAPNDLIAALESSGDEKKMGLAELLRKAQSSPNELARLAQRGMVIGGNDGEMAKGRRHAQAVNSQKAAAENLSKYLRTATYDSLISGAKDRGEYGLESLDDEKTFGILTGKLGVDLGSKEDWDKLTPEQKWAKIKEFAEDSDQRKIIDAALSGRFAFGEFLRQTDEKAGGGNLGITDEDATDDIIDKYWKAGLANQRALNGEDPAVDAGLESAEVGNISGDGTKDPGEETVRRNADSQIDEAHAGITDAKNANDTVEGVADTATGALGDLAKYAGLAAQKLADLAGKKYEPQAQQPQPAADQ